MVYGLIVGQVVGGAHVSICVKDGVSGAGASWLCFGEELLQFAIVMRLLECLCLSSLGTKPSFSLWKRVIYHHACPSSTSIFTRILDIIPFIRLYI